MPGRPRPDVTVVKLGGSHALEPHLPAWLKALAECGGQVIVTPGGGPFADQVRLTQKAMAFDDRAAHHMALLAMEQFGLAICSLEPRLTPAASPRAIRAALRAGRTPVWMPARMALAATELEQSWDLTSDSLAAWLAGRIGAKRVALVKHGPPVGHPPDFDDLIQRGTIDRLFTRYLNAAQANAVILGPADHERLAETMRAP